MKATVLYIGLLLFLASENFAQQLPLYSQQTFNRFAVNPACAGNKNRVEAKLTHRNHMLGFPGAPTTQLLTVSAPWQMKNLGLGIRILNDKVGTANHLSANIAVNYSLILGNGKFTGGLEFGFDQYAVSWESLARVDKDDEIIPTSQTSIIKPNGAAGFFYTTEHWYLGYSIQNLIASKLHFQGPESWNVSKVQSHHYFQAGGVKTFGDKLQLEPYILYKGTANVPWQTDIGLFVVYDQSYGLGLTYRTNDAMVYTLKMELIEQVYVGYSYEMRMNALAAFASSSHEIMVGYYYNLLEPARKKVIHPRYYF